MKFTYCIAVFASVAVPLTFAQGGMAELKSITGDEPYNGIGNAPAPIPQPMGFWGRPRYSPVGYQGMQGMQGYAPSGNWLYGGSPMDRFTSFGHSPYGFGGSWTTSL